MHSMNREDQPFGLNGSFQSLQTSYSLQRTAEKVTGLPTLACCTCSAGGDGQSLQAFASFCSLCCSRIKSFHCFTLHLEIRYRWFFNMGVKEQRRELMVETAPNKNNAVNDRRYIEITTAENTLSFHLVLHSLEGT